MGRQRKMEMVSGDLIANGPVNKTMFLLVIPALLGSVVAQVNFLLDSFFLSRVQSSATTDYLAAVAAAFPIALLLLAFGTMFGIGGSIYAARFLGENNQEKAKKVFSGITVYATVINIALIAILIIFLRPLLTALGAADEVVYGYAKSYALVMIIGSPSIIINFIFVMFARSEGKAVLVLVAIALQTLLNIILNYIFIIPLDLGTFGASLATVIAQTVSTLILAAHLFSKRSVYKFTIKFKDHFNIVDFNKIAFLGLPSTLALALVTVAAIILQHQAVQLNDKELIAGIGILIKFLTIITLIVQAAASGIQPVFSYSVGAKDKNRFKLFQKKYLIYSTATTLVLTILLLIFPNSLANIFKLSEQAHEYVVIGTYGIALMLTIMNYSFIVQVLLQSLDKPIDSLWIVVIRQILIFVPLTIIMFNAYGATGILLSQQVAITLGGIISILLYQRKLTKQINLKFS